MIRSKREGKFIHYELNTSVLEDVMLWITDLRGCRIMKEMIKKYKGTLICSVLVMLAGILVGFTMAQMNQKQRKFMTLSERNVR